MRSWGDMGEVREWMWREKGGHGGGQGRHMEGTTRFDNGRHQGPLGLNQDLLG